MIDCFMRDKIVEVTTLCFYMHSITVTSLHLCKISHIIKYINIHLRKWLKKIFIKLACKLVLINVFVSVLCVLAFIYFANFHVFNDFFFLGKSCMNAVVVYF